MLNSVGSCTKQIFPHPPGDGQRAALEPRFEQSGAGNRYDQNAYGPISTGDYEPISTGFVESSFIFGNDLRAPNQGRGPNQQNPGAFYSSRVRSHFDG